MTNTGGYPSDGWRRGADPAQARVEVRHYQDAKSSRDQVGFRLSQGSSTGLPLAVLHGLVGLRHYRVYRRAFELWDALLMRRC